MQKKFMMNKILTFEMKLGPVLLIYLAAGPNMVGMALCPSKVLHDSCWPCSHRFFLLSS